MQESDGKLPTNLLTGNQIASARLLAGFRTQIIFAKAAGVFQTTVERAEAAGPDYPGMRTDVFVRLISALEAAGVEFYLPAGESLIGGLGFRRRGKGKAA
jgi:hypothetical protein